MTRKSILAATVAALAHTAATLSVSGALRRAAVEVAVARGSHGMRAADDDDDDDDDE